MKVDWQATFLSLLMTLSCAGCAPAARDPTSTGTPTSTLATALSQDGLTIESNTQATVGNLRIGAGNFWEEEYTPEGGSPQNGLTAGLWFYFQEDSSQDRVVRVHPGQEL